MFCEYFDESLKLTNENFDLGRRKHRLLEGGLHLQVVVPRFDFEGQNEFGSVFRVELSNICETFFPCSQRFLPDKQCVKKRFGLVQPSCLLDITQRHYAMLDQLAIEIVYDG